MKLKPSIHLRGRQARRIAALSVAIAAAGGIALAQSTPALADPTESYVAVGSDTTQDVVQQWSVDLSSNTLGSYNAVNPVTAVGGEIVTPTKTGTPVATTPTNCSFTRPNGSGQGLAALRKSINQSTTATQLAAPPQAGCIDIGRSSSGPGSNASTTGSLVYIPFALDGVAGSTGPATGGVVGGITTVATNITQADLFTLTDLKTLYASCGTVTEGGVTYNPGTATTGQQQIDLYVPQSGSGTRNFWASTLGFNATTLPGCVHDTIVAGSLTGTIVEEHDGKAVATDANGFAPFSISQWIGQRNGHNDRRHGAVLHNLNGISPFTTGGAASGSLNTAFPITREVYNIVSYDRVVNTGDGKFDAALASLLVGTNAALCQDQFTITGFGFALLGSTTADQCGSTANTLRAFDPTTNPV